MSASQIPLTRLGGKAFNHSASADTEAEYDRLRDLARQEAAKRNSCFDRAHEAYESGDGALAKSLSDEGKQHAAAMDKYNKQASDFILRENNAPGRVAEDTLDLHGQFVEEAEDILEQRIRYARSQGQTHLHVIVGKGNHSAGHVQKLKPKVEHVCQELGLQYSTEENAGRIYINLQGGEAVPPPQAPGYYGPGEGQGAPAPAPHYGGGAGYGGGQQQQPQQQEEGDIAGKIVSALFKKLGDCCVVM